MIKRKFHLTNYSLDLDSMGVRRKQLETIQPSNRVIYRRRCSIHGIQQIWFENETPPENNLCKTQISTHTLCDQELLME